MLNSYTKLFVNLLIAISYFSQVKSDEIQGIKKPIIEKNPKKDTIFNYIENEVLKHPIHDLSHYKTDDIESLLINYKNPKENNVKYNKESFDLGNSSNIYYYYKYPTKEPGLNENLIDFDDTKDNENNNNRFDSCLGSVAFCSYQRATFLLNKIDSNEEDKRQALELLHKSEKEVPESLFLLGVIYENYDIFFLFNKNITNNKFENDLKSVSYFEKCSSLGDINCQLAVAHKHYLGELLPRDLSKSATLYYSVLSKVIKKYDSNNRYPWILSNHDRNIWNHNFFKFVNDHKLSDFEYVDLNDDSDALVKDSSILLNTKSSLPLSEGSGDLELIKVMHFLHEARNMLKKNSDPEFVKDLMRVNLHNPVFENLKYLYFREDFLFIEDEILLYVYTDIKNSMNGNIFSNDKDMNYVFELLKIIIKIYKDKQTLLDSKLSLLGKYYLRELIIIFTNVYKQYGDFESENEKNINLIFSLYKTANGLSSKVRDETFWEVFKFLHYLNPEADFEKIFYDYIKDKQTTGYATFAVLNYDNGAKIQKIFKENLQADHYIINDFGLQKNIQLGISSKYIPALYQSCKFDFQLLPASQAQEKAIFIQKLRVILESLQMKENIPIFHQNFVNIMNYKTGKSSELNIFAMVQLSSMGFEKAINNIANELIHPVKILTPPIDNINETSIDPILNTGISKYLTSYKLGNLNHGLQLSSIFDNMKQWSKMLSLNYLISDTNGNFYSFYNLGKIYEDGKGVPQDFNKAAEYYSKVLTHDALSSYHDMSMTSNGLEISVQILLLKLKLKKWFYKISFLQKIIERFQNMGTKFFTNFGSLEKSGENIVLSQVTKFKQKAMHTLFNLGIDPSVIWSVSVIAMFALLPQILKHLAKVNRWNITINGTQFVNGVEVGRERVVIEQQDDNNDEEVIIEEDVNNINDSDDEDIEFFNE